MKPGEIFRVNLDPSIGDEIRKKRPVLIINGGHDKHLKLAIVVPVTTWHPAWENHPFFVALDPTSQNGLKKKSAIDCFQLRAVSHRRFTEKLGIITGEQMDSVKRAVALILDIEPRHCT